MKNLTLVLAAIMLSSMCLAQDANWGIKAGLNYNSNGKLKELGNEISADGKTGFHVGAFGKIDLMKLYLRPELVYTKTKSEYEGSDFDMQKLDVPVLLGVELIGPLSVFAGPSFQYILDSDVDNATVDDIKNDITVGFNIGAAVSLGRLGVDLRYERGFSKNEAEIIHDNINTGATLDTRPSQVILSVSLGF